MPLVLNDVNVEQHIIPGTGRILAGRRVYPLMQDATYQTNSLTFATIPINSIIPTIASIGGGLASLTAYYVVRTAGTSGGISYEIALRNDTDTTEVTGSTMANSGNTEVINITPSVITLTPEKAYRISARRVSGGGFVTILGAYLVLIGA